MNRWKEALNLEKYDLDKIRKSGITIGDFNLWLLLLEDFNINVGILDINLYALEFASRCTGRYGARTLPKIPDNSLSEMKYYFLLYENNEKYSDEARKEMFETIIKRTKPETLEKWLKN